MTKFKAGDKVFIHDEELTNPEGPSMYQTYRGTEGKIRGVHATWVDTYWVDVEEGNHSALLSGKHLEPIEEFSEGDWVFVKDEPLTKVAGYGDFPEQGEWYRVHYVYRDGDVHLGEMGGLRLVHKSHLTHNPFKVGDRVTISDDNSIGEDGDTPNGYSATEAMRANPVISGLPDIDGDVKVNGYYVHKRYVKPEPKIDLPVTLGEINALAGVTAEAVDHPEHYNQGAFETIDVIEDWGLNFNVGNALNYIRRYGHKGNPKGDLRKAIWYLERELKSLDI